jgi:hypothetical protein
MYRGGLSRSRIAVLPGVPSKIVGYHLQLAGAADPGLHVAHEAASNSAPSRATAQGVARMQHLVVMVQETGRYPSRNAKSTSERSLAVWLQRRREDARAGAPGFGRGSAWLAGGPQSRQEI